MLECEGRLPDAVIACVGLDATLEGEGGDTGNLFDSGDKPDLQLPEAQRWLMEALAKTGKPLVTVIAAGSALNVPQGVAKLLAWYPGQAGGTALANILFGKVSPSGKLPLTFYHDVSELPDFTDYNMKNRTYRYFASKPLYSFGYGLSYSSFEVSDLHAAPKGDGMEVTVTVRNTGDRAAEEVVQVYVHADAADATPNPCLAAFKRIALAPGESKTVTLEVSAWSLTVVNDAGERLRESNTFDVYAGLSQPDERSCELMGMKPLHARITL